MYIKSHTGYTAVLQHNRINFPKGVLRWDF